MVFPVVMYGCESWTVKKAECRRIDAFELWCWRRLLRVPWTAKRSNQSILKEISPGISLEGMMLKLKLQYFGHLMWRVNSLEKTLMLGRVGGRRRRGRQRMRWLDGITDSMDVNSGSSWWTGRPGVLWFMGSQRVGHDWATELNGTEKGLDSLTSIQDNLNNHLRSKMVLCCNHIFDLFLCFLVSSSFTYKWCYWDHDPKYLLHVELHLRVRFSRSLGPWPVIIAMEASLYAILHMLTHSVLTER